MPPPPGQQTSKKHVTDPNVHDYRIVKSYFVKSCTLLSAPTSQTKVQQPSYVDLGEMRKTENKAIEAAKQ